MNDDLVELSSGFVEGDLDLLAYLRQLEDRFNEREPWVRAFLPEEGRFSRLRAEAKRLLELHPEPRHRPPLFGALVGVKDIFHVDGFPTSAGSQLPTGTLIGPEAESVKRLREAGALIVGKTVTTEFAYFAPGPTRNPHHPEHTPGGSSSGSAAAVAAGLCTMALGTQTIGSIVRPASFCGVVGYKPSYERVSRDGVIPLSPSLDHVGCFAWNVAGAELAASVLVSDWHSSSKALKPVLGVPKGPYLDKASPEALGHFLELQEIFREAGYRIKPVEILKDFEEISSRHQFILAAEAADVHAGWFGRYSHLYHDKTASLIQEGRKASKKALKSARLGRERLRGQLMAVMEDDGIDLWIAPGAPGAAPSGLDSTGDPIMNLPWTQAGLPALSLPSGLNAEGLPFGLQIVGRWQGDEDMFGWAWDLEAVLDYEGAVHLRSGLRAKGRDGVKG
jgi:Asp-tRNA(Asn)/Glu-tRNA(Gln) amidotransferase A subunit family amidase